METVGSILILIIALAIWLVPVLIASVRKHQQVGPIVIVTVLTGWTGIGWIVALAWSLSSTQKATAG